MSHGPIVSGHVAASTPPAATPSVHLPPLSSIRSSRRAWRHRHLTPDPDESPTEIHAPQFLARDLAPPPRTLVDLIVETAAVHPDSPAIDDGTTVLRYRELHATMRDRALTLAEAGVGRGDTVGVRVTSGTTALCTAILGILMVGGMPGARTPVTRGVRHGSGAVARGSRHHGRIHRPDPRLALARGDPHERPPPHLRRGGVPS